MIKLNYQELAEELFEFMVTIKSRPMPPPPDLRGLSKGEMGILVYLMHVKDGVSAGELSKNLHLTTGRIAATLKTLEKKTFIERKADASDGRKVLVYITASGKKIIQSKKKEVLAHLAKNLEKFSIEEAEQFVQLMKKFFTP